MRQEKDLQAMEEVSIFLGHVEAKKEFNVMIMRRLYDLVFSQNPIYATEEDYQMQYDACFQDLIESISLTPELLKLYVAQGIGMLRMESVHRGMPREQAEDITRKTFLQLSKAQKLDEIQQSAIWAMTETNHRYRKFGLGGASHLIRRAVDEIWKRKYHKVSAGMIADSLKCDRTYLAKCFRNELDMTITDYIRKMKMEMAVELITSHSFPLQEVSEILAYSSYGYFSKQFRKYYHTSPEEYEKQYWMEHAQ